jgi:hypothetical protein
MIAKEKETVAKGNSFSHKLIKPNKILTSESRCNEPPFYFDTNISKKI